MDDKRLDSVLAPYNPWWRKADWDCKLPDYQRPIVGEILSDLRELTQIVSVTGPRRVGKSTALKHVVSHLIREQGIDPRRIELSYYREKDREVDFVMAHGGNRYLPIEAKYRKTADQIGGLRSFMGKYNLNFGCVVTRNQPVSFDDKILHVPLRYFLLGT